MRLFHLLFVLLLFVLAGCHGSLSFVLADDDDAVGDDDDSVGDDDDSVGDDDGSVGDDDDSTAGDDDDSTPGDDDDSTPGDDDDSTPGDDDDDEPEHVDCGPWVTPQAGDGEVRVFSGEASLQETSAGWVWEGCEVERFFESSGALDCENLWEASGSMTNWDSGAQAAEYLLEFTYQQGPTSCGGEGDEDWRYLVDYDFGASTLELYWANPGGGNWTSWASAPFVMNGAQTEVEFEYSTEFMGAR